MYTLLKLSIIPNGYVECHLWQINVNNEVALTSINDISRKLN